MEINKFESGRFSQAVDQAAEKLTDQTEKVLADSAARGFAAPPGESLGTILAASIVAKDGLVEATGKIYDERRGQLFQIDEFQMNMIVKLARLAFELYRVQIIEALEIEVAQWNSVRDKQRADVERMNSETQARQVAIVRDRAEAEARIITFKEQLVKAQNATLVQETALVQAQLATAEKKLEIVDAIYQLVAAEQLVVAAEQRRAASLSKVLAAEQIVAQIKQGMVPYYQEKANAEMDLAQATEAEIPVLKAIEELGYDRIALRDAENYEQHEERTAELNLLMAQEDLTRAETALILLREQTRRLLLEYRNQIQATILDQKKALQEEEVRFRLATGLQREAIGVNNDVAIVNHETKNVLSELSSLLSNMEQRALDQSNTVMASANRKSETQATMKNQGIIYKTMDLQRKIIVGTF